MQQFKASTFHFPPHSPELSWSMMAINLIYFEFLFKRKHINHHNIKEQVDFQLIENSKLISFQIYFHVSYHSEIWNVMGDAFCGMKLHENKSGKHWKHRKSLVRQNENCGLCRNHRMRLLQCLKCCKIVCRLNSVEYFNLKRLTEVI